MHHTHKELRSNCFNALTYHIIAKCYRCTIEAIHWSGCQKTQYYIHSLQFKNYISARNKVMDGLLTHCCSFFLDDKRLLGPHVSFSLRFTKSLHVMELWLMAARSDMRNQLRTFIFLLYSVGMLS